MFKGYTPGEPSMRLYVKNLAKGVTEKVRGVGGTPRYHGTPCIQLCHLLHYRTWSIYLDGTSTGPLTYRFKRKCGGYKAWVGY